MFHSLVYKMKLDHITFDSFLTLSRCSCTALCNYSPVFLKTVRYLVGALSGPRGVFQRQTLCPSCLLSKYVKELVQASQERKHACFFFSLKRKRVDFSNMKWHKICHSFHLKSHVLSQMLSKDCFNLSFGKKKIIIPSRRNTVSVDETRHF